MRRMTFDPRQDIEREAGALAQCALDAVQRRFPHKLDHLILDANDHPLPQALHPVFHGSYDWHSSVHMHWSLLCLRPRVPQLAAAIDAQFEQHFTAEQVEVERRYAAAPGRASFERPYGWAWLLKLQAQLQAHAAADAQVRRWAQALAPFAADVAGRLADFVRRSPYPVRAGFHPNSAFALLLARDYALQQPDPRLLEAIDATARRWFGDDRDWPARFEPSGADFLSPGLTEALLMQRVLGDGFAAWWVGFAPSSQDFARWSAPAAVADRADPQGVHLDGLNLSRAWCLASLARSVPPPAASALRESAAAHWRAAWPHVTTGDFAATHWLVSFALLAASA
jgi:hypothetical protein